MQLRKLGWSLRLARGLVRSELEGNSPGPALGSSRTACRPIPPTAVQTLRCPHSSIPGGVGSASPAAGCFPSRRTSLFISAPNKHPQPQGAKAPAWDLCPDGLHEVGGRWETERCHCAGANHGGAAARLQGSNFHVTGPP